jgi:hypothetical protein
MADATGNFPPLQFAGEVLRDELAVEAAVRHE